MFARVRPCATAVSKSVKQWPYIDRPSLSKTVLASMSSKTPAITWIVGGIGSGKSELIYRCADKMIRDASTKGNLTIVVDFEKIDHTKRGDHRELTTSYVARTLLSQACLQVSPTAMCDALKEVIPRFEESLRLYALNNPLLSHFARTITSVNELWVKIVPSSAKMSEIIAQMPFELNPAINLEVSLRLLQKLDKKVCLCLLHIEKVDGLNQSLFNKTNSNNVVQPLFDFPHSFNVLIECNDALTSIWSICEDKAGDTQKIIEVSDLPKEAVKSIFHPSLLNDEAHLELISSMCGGRVGLLEKLVVPLNILNEEQKLEDMQQEQKYKTGKEIRPSAESKELQVNPLLHKKDVMIRDALVDGGVLEEDNAAFMNSIQKMINEFSPLMILQSRMSKIEFKLLLIESARIISVNLKRNGFLPIPAGLSPLDIAHPVVVALLHANILSVAWLPYPRLVADSPLKLFLLETWVNAETNSIPLSEIIQYNLLLTKNRTHLTKQLDKLSH